MVHLSSQRQPGKEALQGAPFANRQALGCLASRSLRVPALLTHSFPMTLACVTRSGKLRARADRVFRVSSSLLRRLKLDAEWAGVGLYDARGRATTVHGIRSGFCTSLRRNATDPALRMRLMRHKSADLTLGTYDKVERDELRRELERLPVANALRMAAGAESASVLMPVNSRPLVAAVGRSGPDDAPSTVIAESANVAHVWPSRPDCAAPGRSGPERDDAREVVGPAGLEPATKRV